MLPYRLDQDDNSRRAALDMDRLRGVVEQHKEMLYAVFAYYGITNGQRGEKFTCWSMAKFMRFVDDCALADAKQEGARKEDLENIFIATVQQVKSQVSAAAGNKGPAEDKGAS